MLFRKLLPPLRLRSEVLRYGEERHDGVVVEAIHLHLIQNLKGIRQSLRHIAEDIVHLLTRLKPLLLGIEHTRRIIKILTRRETKQMVVSFSILLIHEMGIVGTDEFDTIFLSQFDEYLIRLLLQGESLAVCPLHGVGHLMPLQLQIVVVAPKALVPLDGLAGTCNIAFQDLRRHFASDTGRADNQILVVFLKFHTVCTWAVIESVDPGIADEFDEVLIAVGILGQHDEVIAAKVFLCLFQAFVSTTGHIHLATEDRFERFEAFLLTFFVHPDADVVKFFDTEHIAVIGNGHASHAVLNSFVYKPLDTRLSIED